MAKHLLLAFTNPVAGREDQYNEWYNNIAYPTCKSMPGLVPFGRFNVADVPPLFDFEAKNIYECLSLYFY